MKVTRFSVQYTAVRRYAITNTTKPLSKNQSYRVRNWREGFVVPRIALFNVIWRACLSALKVKIAALREGWGRSLCAVETQAAPQAATEPEQPAAALSSLGG